MHEEAPNSSWDIGRLESALGGYAFDGDTEGVRCIRGIAREIGHYGLLKDAAVIEYRMGKGLSPISLDLKDDERTAYNGCVTNDERLETLRNGLMFQRGRPLELGNGRSCVGELYAELFHGDKTNMTFLSETTQAERNFLLENVKKAIAESQTIDEADKNTEATYQAIVARIVQNSFKNFPEINIESRVVQLSKAIGVYGSVLEKYAPLLGELANNGQIEDANRIAELLGTRIVLTPKEHTAEKSA